MGSEIDLIGECVNSMVDLLWDRGLIPEDVEVSHVERILTEALNKIQGL